ncbi:MAG: thiamine pyrophosphate-binding protein, partial [Calditrichaeota bacterium]|nr:thiamine pyrophosphate-binding protein [Calditrichota bacterium]
IYVEAENQGIRVIDVRDEASALFAADATARLTGIPGVAVVTAGPGVANTITALKNAQMAQSPLLLLGGATATLLRNRGALQDIDQMALVKPHVKWATIVNRQREIAPALNKAIRIARSGVPGPVFVELPVDLLYNEETVREWYGKKSNGSASLLDKALQWYINRHVNGLFKGMQNYVVPGGGRPLIPTFTQTEVNAVARAVKRAERPVMVISSGAMMEAENVGTLCAAVKRLGIPVYLSGMARGLTGHISEVQYRHKRKMAMREADCIVLCGVPVDFRLDYGSHLNRRACKIAINRSREELKKNISPYKAVLADPGAFLIELSGAADIFPDWREWKQQLQKREEAREQEIRQTAEQPIEGINPVALFLQMEDLMPRHSVLIADGGDFAATASYTLRPRRPLAWLDPGVFGTLGVGGGFALGAALRYPDDYIWIIYGDGSAAYSLMEMDTFKKYGMKVCGIIGNNGSWEQIARDQVTLLGKNTATSLPRSDYQKVAEAFGAAGERVDKLEDVEGALKRAMESMDSGVPYVINAIIGSTDFRQGSISI